MQAESFHSPHAGKNNIKIGIIGAGNIGRTVERKLVAEGHSVKLAGAKRPDNIRENAEKIGVLLWMQQPGTSADCKDLNAVQLKAALARANHAEIKRYRKEANKAAAPYLKPFEG